MKGKVEIFAVLDGDREKLVYEEDNLVVNGAGQTIVDMLTAPSSTLGIAPRVMDTSNWVVQAISFGKDAQGYFRNAHAYPVSSYTCPSPGLTVANRNLNPYSTPSSTDLFSVVGGTINSISSTPEVSPPSMFSNIPSSTAHVVTVVDDDINLAAGATSGYFHPCRMLEGYGGVDFTASAFQDTWLCWSLYTKQAFGDYPINNTGCNSNDDTDHGGIHIKLTSKGDGYSGDSGLGNARTAINLYTDLTNGSISGVNQTWRTESARTEANGWVVPNWEANAGVEYAGDNWYRAWVSVLSPSATSGIEAVFYPALCTDGGASGGAYIYGCQLEVGKFPTELQFRTDGVCPNNWDFSGSTLAMGRSFSGVGLESAASAPIVRVSGPPDVSSYYPYTGLPTYPDPLDGRLEGSNTESEFSLSSVVTGFDLGQNLNLIPYRQKFALQSKFIEQNNLSSLWNAKNSSDGVPNNYIGVNAYQLGCFPEGSSTGGTNWSMVSSLTTSAAFENQIVSGNYNSGFNEASSMDISGYVGRVYDPINERVGDDGNGVTLSGHGLIVSSQAASYQNNGRVVYETNVLSGDLGLANLYGGIYNIGLWTVDIKEALKYSSPPFVFDPIDNPLRYRLFSSKKFIDNLSRISDNGATAGSLNYADLKIRWTLDFRATGNA
jgi:hypothetical protein